MRVGGYLQELIEHFSLIISIWKSGHCRLQSCQACSGCRHKSRPQLRSEKDQADVLVCFLSNRFYPRWRDWEVQQALELDYTLDEAQLAEDWAGLLNLASQPGASLEQLHVFCLAHVLRRPIIVYGVKFVKSWRGENLGFARFEGASPITSA